ncbi:MAG: DUF3440 domain-containing protein [Clostridiales bacterium]|nr:DUF3440 domain-containing protein [Clostridiales bacterium]
MSKIYQEQDVCQWARQIVKKTFDDFPRIYVSFSGGKDSTVMLHLVLEEAKRRRRKVGVLFVDLEAQYKITIDFVRDMFALYARWIEPYWVCLPISLRNAVSMYAPKWTCWGDGVEWVRQPPDAAITDRAFFPFFQYGMEFEEFVPQFGQWYSRGERCACLIGIRADESLNRWRTVASKTKACYEGRQETTWCGGDLYNVYPLYNWKTRDVWIYYGKYKKPYNTLYDHMHKAGLTINQMRICQPYGDSQRKGLWLYQMIEPETWAKVVARVNGANQGALYARDTGNILGVGRIHLPPGHTWKSFSLLLLDTMPEYLQEHYKNKIASFLNWWQNHGYPDGIPDELPSSMENAVGRKRKPSWRRICKTLLRNDYWCQGLSFSPTKSEHYEQYQRMMKMRRERWRII